MSYQKFKSQLRLLSIAFSFLSLITLSAKAVWAVPGNLLSPINCTDPTNDACSGAAGNGPQVVPNPPSNGFLVMLSPSSLDFNQIALNTKSPTQQVTITNIDSNAITLGYVSATVDFSILTTSTCSQQMSLAPSASCTFDLSFTPSVLGVTDGFLTIGVIDSNNKAQGVPVSLTGTGIQGTVISPNQTPTLIPDPKFAASGGCSIDATHSAQASSILSLLPFGLVAFARASRKK